MVDETPTPIVVPKNAGVIDSVQAAIRLIGFLITAFMSIVGFLKAGDIAGLLAFIQSSGGQIFAAVSGLVALAIAGYGVFKTHKRGAQIATVAASPKVPNSIATTS